MDWFSLFLNSALIAAIGFIKLLFVQRFTGRKAGAAHVLTYLLWLYGGDLLAKAAAADWLAYGLDLLFLYFGSRFVLKAGSSASLAAAVIAVYVSQLSFGIMNPLETLLFPEFLGNTLALQGMVILASVLSVGLCACCFRLILKQIYGLTQGQQTYMWLMLPPCLFFAAVEFYILHTAYGPVLVVPYPSQVGTQLSLLTLQLIGLGALFCMLYAYKRICEGMKAQAAAISLNQEVNYQKSYVTEARLRYERTRAFRHDMKNHLKVLAGFLRNQDYEQALAYLEKLDITAEQMNFTVQTGNPVVDILLVDKLGYAREKGIRTEVSLALPKQAADDLDLCVIFANALDNAIRACEQAVQPGYIRVAGGRQGDFYMLQFENTRAPGPLKEAGIGLSNIKTAAEKYGGAMTIEETPASFCLCVLLNISIPSESISEQKY